MTMRRLVLAACMTVVVLGTARAEPGTGVLEGTSRLTVKRCGTARGMLGGMMVVAGDGTWSFQSPGEDTYHGTSTPIGRSGRKLRLTPDAAATAAEVASAQEEISTLCGLAVTVTDVHLKAATLSLDRKRTTAKLVVRYVFAGTANGRHGTATLKLVGKGPWTPG